MLVIQQGGTRGQVRRGQHARRAHPVQMRGRGAGPPPSQPSAAHPQQGMNAL